jgi:hypothetical protein
MELERFFILCRPSGDSRNVSTPAADLFRKLAIEGAALEWAESERRSVGVAWATCPRGDWLVTAAARLGIERRLVVQPALGCTVWALPLVPAWPVARAAWELADAWHRRAVPDRNCLRAGHDARAAAEAETDEARKLALGSIAALALACDDDAADVEWSSRAFAGDSVALADAAFIAAGRRYTRTIVELVREHLPFEKVARPITMLSRADRISGVRPVVEVQRQDDTVRIRRGE